MKKSKSIKINSRFVLSAVMAGLMLSSNITPAFSECWDAGPAEWLTGETPPPKTVYTSDPTLQDTPGMPYRWEEIPQDCRDENGVIHHTARVGRQVNGIPGTHYVYVGGGGGGGYHPDPSPWTPPSPSPSPREHYSYYWPKFKSFDESCIGTTLGTSHYDGVDSDGDTRHYVDNVERVPHAPDTKYQVAYGTVFGNDGEYHDLNFASTCLKTPGKSSYTYTGYDVGFRSGDIDRSKVLFVQDVGTKEDRVYYIGGTKTETSTYYEAPEYYASSSIAFKQKDLKKTGQGGTRTLYTYYKLSNPNSPDLVVNPDKPQKIVTTKQAVASQYNIGNVEKVEKTITPETEYSPDASLQYKATQTTDNGENGVATTTNTYRVDKKTGLTNEITNTETRTTKEAKKKKVSVGNVKTETKEINPETEYYADSNLDYKKDKVVTQGEKGSTTTTTTYKVDKDKGLTDTVESSTTNTTKAKNTIKHVGNVETTHETVKAGTDYKADSKLDYKKTSTEQGSDGENIVKKTYKVDKDKGLTDTVEKTESTVKTPVKNTVVSVGNVEKVEKAIKVDKHYNADPSLKYKDTKETEGHDGISTTTNVYKVDPKSGLTSTIESTKTETTKDAVATEVNVGNVEKIETPIAVKNTYKADSKLDYRKELTEAGTAGVSTTTNIYKVDPKTGLTSTVENTSTETTTPMKKAVVSVGNVEVEDKDIEPTTVYVPATDIDFNTQQTSQDPKKGKVRVTTTYEVNPDTGLTDHVTSTKQDILTPVTNKKVKIGVVKTTHNPDGSTTVETFTVDPNTGKLSDKPTKKKKIIAGTMIQDIAHDKNIDQQNDVSLQKIKEHLAQLKKDITDRETSTTPETFNKLSGDVTTNQGSADKINTKDKQKSSTTIKNDIKQLQDKVDELDKQIHDIQIDHNLKLNHNTKDKIPVIYTDHLSKEEKQTVKDKIKEENKDLKLIDDNITVADNGDTTVQKNDKNGIDKHTTIKGTDIVTQDNSVHGVLGRTNGGSVINNIDKLDIQPLEKYTKKTVDDVLSDEIDGDKVAEYRMHPVDVSSLLIDGSAIKDKIKKIDDLLNQVPDKNSPGYKKLKKDRDNINNQFNDDHYNGLSEKADALIKDIKDYTGTSNEIQNKIKKIDDLLNQVPDKNSPGYKKLKKDRDNISDQFNNGDHTGLSDKADALIHDIQDYLNQNADLKKKLEKIDKLLNQIPDKNSPNYKKFKQERNDINNQFNKDEYTGLSDKADALIKDIQDYLNQNSDLKKKLEKIDNLLNQASDKDNPAYKKLQQRRNDLNDQFNKDEYSGLSEKADSLIKDIKDYLNNHASIQNKINKIDDLLNQVPDKNSPEYKKFKKQRDDINNQFSNGDQTSAISEKADALIKDIQDYLDKLKNTNNDFTFDPKTKDENSSKDNTKKDIDRQSLDNQIDKAYDLLSQIKDKNSDSYKKFKAELDTINELYKQGKLDGLDERLKKLIADMNDYLAKQDETSSQQNTGSKSGSSVANHHEKIAKTSDPTAPLGLLGFAATVLGLLGFKKKH